VKNEERGEKKVGNAKVADTVFALWWVIVNTTTYSGGFV
jgi:hypothetical protein